MPDCKFYFHQVEYPVDTHRAAHQVMRNATADETARFNEINTLTGGGTIYRGHPLIVPSSHGASHEQIAQAKLLGERLAHGHRHRIGQPAPEMVNENWGTFLYSQMKDPQLYLSISQNFGGQAFHQAEDVMKRISSNLNELNKSYMTDASRLRGATLENGIERFSVGSAARQNAYRTIDDLLGRLPRVMNSVGDSGLSSKDALKISTKAAKRAFRLQGASGEIKQISQAVQRTDQMASRMKLSGRYLGVPFTAVSGALTIWDVHNKIAKARQQAPNVASEVAVYQASRAAGGVAAGYAAGVAVELGAALVLGTNPVGWALLFVAVVGVAAGVGATYYGSDVAGDAAMSKLKEVDPRGADDLKVYLAKQSD